MPNDQWDTMTDGERDAWVARRVMGWKFDRFNAWWSYEESYEPRRSLETPRFTTDPTADYAVLCRVRETWCGADAVPAFHRALQELWRPRRLINPNCHLHNVGGVMYEPGDYSRAAYLTLTGATT